MSDVLVMMMQRIIISTKLQRIIISLIVSLDYFLFAFFSFLMKSTIYFCNLKNTLSWKDIFSSLFLLDKPLLLWLILIM
jgi:hypothetical protein